MVSNACLGIQVTATLLSFNNEGKKKKALQLFSPKYKCYTLSY